MSINQWTLNGKEQALIKIKVEESNWLLKEKLIDRVLKKYGKFDDGIRIEIEVTAAQGSLGFLKDESPEE